MSEPVRHGLAADRAALRAALARYRVRHPFEGMTVDRFVRFVDAHTRCFDRRNAAGHVTASAWLVDAAGTRVLLTHHKKLGRWLQLGGHLEGDADLLAAAVREAREESGLGALEAVMPELFDIDIHAIPARGAVAAHEHYDLRFALRATGGEAVTRSGESHDLAWVAVADLRAVTDEPSILRMAAKWSARAPQPR